MSRQESILAETQVATVVDVQNLTKIFDNKLKAVDQVSFTITEGEIFGFLGPNGAGKTTTIKMLTTLLKPTSGRAFIDGIDVTREPDRVRGIIGYMPDFFGV